MRKRFQLQRSLPKVESVLGRLGYNPKKTDLADWRYKLESRIAAVSHRLEAQGIVDTFSVVKRENNCVELENGLVFFSSRLATVLSKSDEVTVMGATLGWPIVKEIQNLLHKGEVSEAALLDAIASESIEHFVDWMQAVLSRERLRFGYVPTMRFSPGYGDWFLDVQPTLLEILDAKEIGLSAHPETYILQPEKSITAVLGWERR